MTPVPGHDVSAVLSIFFDLAGIDSESGKEGNASLFIKDFCSALGLEVHEDDAGLLTGGECGNLVIKAPATSGCLSVDRIILNAHMDTVPPGTGVVPIDDDDRFRTAGETILGADDKVGVAAILATLEHVTRSGEEHRGIDAVITVQEEPGLLGAKNLDFSLLEGDWGVVLDGSGPVGGIIMEAPGQYRLKFEVRGRSAHAGVEPEKGINAISCAAEAISGLDLGRLDPQTTANIGLIEGGRAVNIVPDLVVVEGEIRSLSEGRLEEERERMVERFKQVAGSRGCGLGLEVERSFHGFKLDPDAKPVQHLLKAMRMCGVEPDLITSGGGSDANVFNVRGITAATMNIGLVNAHSQQEYVLKEDLVTVTRIVSSLVSMTYDEQGVGQP